MTDHKSHIYQDIDKHPLPEMSRKIDVKIECGSVLIGCSQHYGYIIFNGHLLSSIRITQWRYSK